MGKSKRGRQTKALKDLQAKTNAAMGDPALYTDFTFKFASRRLRQLAKIIDNLNAAHGSDTPDDLIDGAFLGDIDRLVIAIGTVADTILALDNSSNSSSSSGSSASSRSTASSNSSSHSTASSVSSNSSSSSSSS